MVILSVVAIVVVLILVVAAFWNPAEMRVMSQDDKGHGEQVENAAPREQHHSKKSVEES